MKDAEIVALYWERNEAALEETAEKYERYLMKIAMNVLSDTEDSQESVNDTYLKAWNSMPPHRPNMLSTYLGKITRRLSIDILRRKTSEKRGGSQYQLSLSELSDCVGEDSTQKEVDLHLLGEAIGVFLHTLSPQTRNVFVSRYYFMDSIKEIAVRCGMSDGGVKMLLYRTRLGLREYLRKEEFLL